MMAFVPPVGKSAIDAHSTHIAFDYASLALLADPIAHASVQETLIVGGMDVHFRLVAMREYSGDCASVTVRPTDLCTIMAQHNARFLFLAHNHPSGIAVPSRADIAFTRAMAACAQLQSIQLIDHLIYADGAWCSLRQRGQL